MTDYTRISCAILVAGIALASAWAGDYILLTKGDSGDETSFYDSARWSDKRAPHPDADYIVTNNFLLRAPPRGSEGSTTNHVFGGRSLTIGTPSSPGQLGVRTRKTNDNKFDEKTTVNDLILVNGMLRQIVGDNDTRLHGAITVKSPASAPFKIRSSETQTRTIHIDATISGEEGTALQFEGDRSTSTCRTMLQSANTNYFGTLTIGGGSGNQLILNNPWSAGGDLSTYTPKGIVVQDGATLRFNASSFTYTNRGIYVDSSGGVLQQIGVDTHVRMPLAGEGTLTKTGSAQTTFNGTWTGVTLDVREGTFAVQSDSPTPGEGAAVVISGGTFGLFNGTAPNLSITLNSGLISPWSASTGDLVLSNATVTGGGVRIDYANGRYDTLTLDGDSTFTPSTFRVNVANYQPPSDTNRYPVLVMPTSVGTLTEDMLVFGGAVNDEYGYPACLKVEVETVDDVQTLYLSRTNGVVRLVTNQSGGGTWTTASAWSDNIGLRAGVDFLIDATTCSSSSDYFAARTPNNDNLETFVGRSLTVCGSTAKSARVLIKAGGLAGTDIRMGDNGWICGSGSASNRNNQYVTGTVTVVGTSTSVPATFSTSNNRTFEVRAELNGSGVLGVSATTENQSGAICFTRPNPDFTGKFIVKTNYKNDSDKTKSNVRMQITSEECLGATPATLRADAVDVRDGCYLESVCDVTLDDPTRGLTFAQATAFSVVSGTVLTVKTPLTVKGTLRKKGKGSLVLDSDMTANGVSFCIDEGLVYVNRADMFWAFYRIRSAVGTVAAFVFSAQPANEEIGTYGLARGRDDGTDESPFLDGDTSIVTPYLPVQIDFGDTPPSGTYRIPLCSILPTKAASLRGHINVQTAVKGYRCTIEEDTVTYKDKTLTRFTAVYRPTGACIIFR